MRLPEVIICDQLVLDPEPPSPDLQTRTVSTRGRKPRLEGVDFQDGAASYAAWLRRCLRIGARVCQRVAGVFGPGNDAHEIAGEFLCARLVPQTSGYLEVVALPLRG
jgi:hypothetical protein